MKRPFITACLCAGAAAAQPISAPLLGITADRQNRIHGVFGVTGNFNAGAALHGPVVDYAFSGNTGLLKTGDSLILIDNHAAVSRRLAAPDGPALFAFRPDGTPGLCYLPAIVELWQIGADRRMPLDSLNGEVLDILWRSDRRASLLIRRDGRLWTASIDLKSGQVLHEVLIADLSPGSQALLLGNGLLTADEDVRIRWDNGAETKVPLPQPARRLRRIGNGWIEIGVDTGPPFALRLNSNQTAALYRLPLTGASQ